MKRINDEILAEAERCLGCKIPRCKEACPASANIPQWIAALKRGDGEAAFEIIAEQNVFGPVCGAVCPHEAQCQGACVRGIKERAVAIGKMEKYVGDEFFRPFERTGDELRGKKVAVVGAGPSGLSCALPLAQKGAKVVVWDKHPQAGGVPLFGIPTFRLDKEYIKKLVKNAENLGVEFRLGTKVGDDVAFDEIAGEYDAVFVATGLQNDVKLNIVGEEKRGVVCGNEWLKNPVCGKEVIVIGGGNVAMDCARTAVRLGARVTVAYRRTYKEMPAFEAEKQAALEENVKFEYLLAPIEVVGKDCVDEVRFEKMRLGEQGADGRASVLPTGEFVGMPCDTLIVASGSRVDLAPFGGKLAAANGKIVVDEDMRVGNTNVFAGGDVTDWKNTVVAAAVDGKKTARSIERFLKEN